MEAILQFSQITISDGAVIAAGSVVIRDVLSVSLVAVNPAKNMKYITKESSIFTQYGGFFVFYFFKKSLGVIP